MVELFKGGVVNVPDRASGPLQPPAPIQAEVLVDDHVNTEVEPIAIDVGLALNVSVGAGVGVGVGAGVFKNNYRKEQQLYYIFSFHSRNSLLTSIGYGTRLYQILKNIKLLKNVHEITWATLC